ncbi:MAG: hypothetical protein BEN18_03620 [Epulopiscium sp. Nuni2H_MBin001]|nr:MAG: hypothetical protein BEN18_03620 [Epulopiscium sp. Nuni2H_MBin001]
MDKLGYIFELGFNIGIASCFQDRPDILDMLKNKAYGRESIYSKIANGDEVIRKNIDYLLFKGMLSGQNFFTEWINGRDYKLEYFQANFCNMIDDISVERDYYRRCLQSQLSISLRDDEVKRLFERGHMFRADTIIMVTIGYKYYICVVDNAISLKNVVEYSDIKQVKNVFEKSIFKRKMKGSFSNLGISCANNTDIKVALRNYIIGLAATDKPLFKMIQAGSYAYSFVNLISTLGSYGAKIKDICVVGYTDEEICSSNVSMEQLDILETCFKTYRTSGAACGKYKENREAVFRKIKSTFKNFFNIDPQTLNNLINLGPGINTININEQFTGYQNTAGQFKYDNHIDTFRNVHAMQIKKYIANKDIQLIFLTGNAGIGKTTAIVEYLKQQEGFLFVYLSPRLQVNQDIEHKFGEFHGVCLSANGTDESSIDGEDVNVVNFRAKDTQKFTRAKGPIKFLHSDRKMEPELERTKFSKVNDTTFSKATQYKQGVLNRLAQAINVVISENLTNKIVATGSIQSLKATSNVDSTARHLIKIFSNMYNEKTKRVDEVEFYKFATNYPNVVLMVDEITGDEGGVAFFNELIAVMYRKIYNNLPPHLKALVNFKIVVADASITNVDVIKKHFNDIATDSDKIYFSKSKIDESFSVNEFKFKLKYNAVSINTNSFPARNLHMNYNLRLNCKNVQHANDIYCDEVLNMTNQAIANEAVNLILGNVKQVIIYVQNIERLNIIKDLVVNCYTKLNGPLEKNLDWVMINSTLSATERQAISQYKDNVKFVFMTSSASRGISFPNTTCILVDVPKFNLEQNIMEILQLIYRGRGNHNIDLNADKHLKFFINEVIAYQDTIDKYKIQEKLINIFTLLTLIKASILTRIYGSCQIAHQDIALIPVGGKGVSGSSDMLIENFSSLINTLKRESYKDDLKYLHTLREKLIKIFSGMTIETAGEIYNMPMPDIKEQFYKLWDRGMIMLLNFKPLINPIIVGDLMVFKLKKQVTSYLDFRLDTTERLVSDATTVKQLLREAYFNEDAPLAFRQQLITAGHTLNYFVKHANERSLSLKDTTQSNDIYVAMPIVAIFAFDEFEQFSEIAEARTWKQILQDYIKAYYSVCDMLPISPNYQDVPFIFFRSTALSNMRNRIYNSNYIFCSSELNLLNLLLLH